MMMPKWSKLKPTEKFETMWLQHGFNDSGMQKEHVFDDDHGYRFDYAWPSCFLAVEIHGFGYGHQAIRGLIEDCVKIRHAMILGWAVLPFTQSCISSKDKCLAAVLTVNELLSRRHGKVQWNT